MAGHGVASGRTPDPLCPGGTIARQVPFFARRGVDLAALVGAAPVMGTINLDLAPCVPRVIAPEIALAQVAWSPHIPPENFWLFRAELHHAGQPYRALIYMPDPATKPSHFQPTTVIEIIAGRIAGLAPGDTLDLSADPAFIRFG